MEEMRAMNRRKNFIYMNVLDLGGKKIGYIKELLIDWNKKRVIGFEVSSNGFLSKSIYILREHIVYINKDIIISSFTRNKYFSFEKVINMDVINLNGEILGLLKDIIFSEEDFIIRGIILSTGIIRDFTQGKKVLLIDGILVGEHSVLYCAKVDSVQLSSKAHKIKKISEECEEK
ncbi:MAG: PRC-barrel domain-containing protein [Clostridium sp.]